MAPSLATPGLIIFDCDGVLVDSEYLANQVLAALLTEAGYPLTTERSIELFTGSTRAALFRQVEAELGRRLPDGFPQRVDSATLAAFDTRLRAVDGAAALLADLRISWCIATSGAPGKWRTTLAATGLATLAAGRVFHAGQVAHGKPAPDLFLFAAAAMGTEPHDCLVIEDAPRGLEAAAAAGMPALAFAGGSHMHSSQRARLVAAGVPLLERLDELRSVVPGAFR